MKFKNNILLGSLVSATAAFIVGCGSGTSNSTTPTSIQVVVPTESQILTPVSANTRFNSNVQQGLNKAVKLALNATTESSCLQLVESGGQDYATSISGSSSWSTATLQFGITNTCSSYQAINAQISVSNPLINGAAIPTTGFGYNEQSGNGAPYSTVAASGTASNPILTVTSPSCTGAGCNWAMLAPGATLGIGAYIQGAFAPNSFTVSGITLESATPPAPPTTGTLNLDLSASGLSTVCSGTTNCNLQVNVISPANIVVATETLNANTSTASNYSISNLAPGTYTVAVVESSIPSVSTGTITSSITPASTPSITAGQTTTTNVAFGFNATPLNTVTVDLNTASIPAQFINNTIYGRILNSSGSTVASGFSFTNGNLSQVVPSAGFVDGQTYTLELQGLADPKSGVYYSPIIESFTYSGTNTTVTSTQYQAVPSNQLYTVNLAVQNAQSGQTIGYGSDTNYYSYAIDTFAAGTYTFLESDTITLTPGSVIGYTSTFSPTNTLTNANAGQTITLVNTQALSSLQYCVDSLCQAKLSQLTVSSNVGEANTQTIFVQNLGTTTATLPTATSFSTNVSGLSVVPGSCTTTLAPNAICSLNVTYQPTATVSQNSTTMTYDSAPLLVNYLTTNNTSKVMGEYWCGFSGSYCGQSTGNDVNSAATHVIMAFANSNSDGSIAVDPTFPTSLVSSWQTAGKVVTLSVGGQNVSWTNIFANTNTFAQSVQAIVQQYGLNGVDLDIENGTATPQQVADAINLLRAYLGESATITIAPQNVGVAQNVGSVPSANVSAGVSGWNYFVPVLQNSLNSLTLVYNQEYNNGCGSTTAGTAQYLECGYVDWLNLPNQSALTGGNQISGFVGVPVSKLIVGTIASTEAGGAEYYNGMTPITGFYTAYPNARGFMFWDSYWDAQNGDLISNGIASMLNL